MLRLLIVPPAPLRKSDPKPPPGFHAAPGSKHGGWTDGQGRYWYPGHVGQVQAVPPGKGAAEALDVHGSGPAGSVFAISSHPAVAQPKRTALVHLPTGRVLGQIQGQSAAMSAVEALHDKHSEFGADKAVGGFLDAKDYASAKSTIATATAAPHVSMPKKQPTAAPASAPPPVAAEPASPATMTKVGDKPGGASPGSVVAITGRSGNWLLKPEGPVKVTAEAAGSQLAALVLGAGNVNVAEVVPLEGVADELAHGFTQGTVQQMMPHAGALPKSGPGLAALSHDDHAELLASHVANWLVADHDAHGGQYLRKPDGNGLLKIDFAQAFKHLGDDKLDTSYHPNAKFGEAQPAPIQVMAAFEAGKIPLDFNDPRILKAVEAAEAIPDATIEQLVKPYADASSQAFGKSAAGIVAAVVARKKSVRADFEDWFSRALTKRMGQPIAFKFGAPPVAKSFRFTFAAGLLKATRETGVAPLPEDAIVAEDGSLTERGEDLLESFARLVQSRHPDAPTNRAAVALDDDLGPVLQRLALAGDIVDDVLSDVSARRAVGRIAA
jgi:hypothetical protein